MLLRKRESAKVTAACDETSRNGNFEKFGYELKKPRSNRHKYQPGPRCFRGCFLAGVLFWLSLQLLSRVISIDPCVTAQRSLQQLSSEVGDSLHNINAIPKIIHQQWRSSTVQNDPDYQHARFGDWHEAWLRLYPESEGYHHMLWTDDAMFEHIQTHYAWFLPVYQGYDVNIKRIDAARYFILDHYGGLYADMDYEPLQNFWPYLAPHRVSLIQSPFSLFERVQNSLMASPPHHPFWNATFEALQQRAHWPKIMTSTGPKMVYDVMETTPSSYWYELPCENFHRIPSIRNSASPWIMQKIVQEGYKQISLNSCGDWGEVASCQWGRHHSTVSWIPNGHWQKVKFIYLQILSIYNIP